MAVRVLSVGSCGSDDARLARVIAAATGARMEAAYTVEEAMELMREKEYGLVLVNRVIDGDGSLGVDFISEVKKAGVGVPLMLVSDYAEAQAQAVANGAVMGFGKSTIFSEETGQRLKDALAPA